MCVFLSFCLCSSFLGGFLYISIFWLPIKSENEAPKYRLGMQIGEPHFRAVLLNFFSFSQAEGAYLNIFPYNCCLCHGILISQDLLYICLCIVKDSNIREGLGMSFLWDGQLLHLLSYLCYSVGKWGGG